MPRSAPQVACSLGNILNVKRRLEPLGSCPTLCELLRPTLNRMGLPSKFPTHTMCILEPHETRPQTER
jgi:hypothetical protein